MKKPIFIKIFFGYLLVILAMAGLILIVSFQTIRSHYIETYTTNLKSLGTPILQITSSLIEEGKIQELNTRVRELGDNLQTRITIIDKQGIVLVDSLEKGELLESHENRPEVISALEGNTGTSIRFSTTLKRDMLYVALPIQMRGEIKAVLRLSLPLQDIEGLLGKIRKNIMESASIILGISLIIALIFSQVFSMPVRTINRASRKVASGDFKARVSLHSNDEIGELAESFNDMTEKLDASFTELSEKKDELEGIISSISEILLVLDLEGKILLFNDGAAKISTLVNLKDRYYWEVIRSSQLSRMVSKVDKDPVHSDIQLGQKSYLCSITPVQSGIAKVVLLHDITEMKQMEQIKKDLVVNVSHELRTPLTAIKGFAETLVDDSDEKSREYLNIILKHTDRLINIVSDLLKLSELEERKDDLKTDDVDIMSLIDKAVVLFEQKAKTKGLQIRVDELHEPAIIQADSFRLEQLLSNLIDNAIKYTEKGTITISVDIKPDTVSIKVRDTGIGIPKEHIPRIFERFYVADKSRSRSLGGTGLGLAIVKHIAHLHGGDATVSSEAHQGTTVTITLPLKHLP